LKKGAITWTVCILLLQPLFSETIPPEAAVENLTTNWKGDDTNPLPSPDGSFLVFQSDRPGSLEDFNFWFSYNKNHSDRTGASSWTIPVPLRFPLTGEASDTMKILRPQGSVGVEPGLFSVNSDGFDGGGSILWRNDSPVEMYFTSDAKARGEGYDGLNIYYTRFRDDRWSKPIQIDTLCSNFDDRMPWISKDGLRIVFSSNRPGGYGGYDLYFADRDPKTGKWSLPVNAGPKINSEADEISPSFSPDRGMLFFSSNREGGLGHFDIYVSRFREDSFEAAENLGRPFNSERDDEYFTITEDRLWAYFASERQHVDAAGRLDLYRTALPDWLRDPVDVAFSMLIMDASTRLPLGLEATVKIQWEKDSIVRHSKPFNKDPKDLEKSNFEQSLVTGRQYRVVISAPGFYPQEILLDYRGSVPSSKKDHRIVYLEPVKQTNPEESRIVRGRIVDAATDLPLSSTRLRKVTAGKDAEKIETIPTDNKGHFELRLTKGEKFTLRADAPGYTQTTESFEEKETLKEIVLRLKPSSGDPCKGDLPECIENLRIFFALGASDLSPSEKRKLDAVIRILKKNPDLRIEIRGHTDRTFRGPEQNSMAYNQKLSEIRSASVRRALVEGGIDTGRLITVGKSYLEPEESETSAAGRDRNRRVEFRRLSLDK